MEKQKVIEKATKCLDAIKMGHGNYRPFGYVEFADKIYEEWEDFYATVVMMAKESERKKGHWIGAECRNGMTERRCSECNCFAGYGVSSLPWFNFCPWCGADMRGGEHATD